MKRWLAGLACVALTAVAAALAPATATAGARPQTHTHPLVGSTAPAPVQPRVGGQASRAAPTSSVNWSGYDVTGGPFTSVTATWTQPRVRSAGATVNDAAFWVGLDGDTSNTVEQIGTEGFNQNGVGYDAWYELYPASPVSIPMTISPGDVLTGAVVTSDGATFTLSLVDHTSGASFQKVQTVSPATLSSAEVIAEAPTDDLGNVVPLADFGLVSFTSCDIDGQPIGGLALNQIDMVDAGNALIARTSALGADGASFTVASDLKAPTTKVAGAGAAWHDRSVTLRFTATDNAGGTGVAYTESSLDGGATWTKGRSLTIPAPSDHANDGSHTVLYRSADKAGNLEKSRSGTVRIDTRRPTPVADSAATAVRGARAVLPFSVSDPRPGSATATVTIRIVDTSGKLARKAVLTAVKVDSPRGYAFICRLARGHYRFIVYATDAAGNKQSQPAANQLVVR